MVGEFRRMPRYVIGVDGGASRTRSLLVDLEGKAVSRALSGPSNPMTVGFDGSAKAIVEAVSPVKESCRNGSVLVACLAIAGVDRPQSRQALLRALEPMLHVGRVIVVSDARAALSGSVLENRGVVAICGTGSVAYGINEEGVTSRSGGWGWLLGDEGSGYDIGRKALSAALRAHDGRGEPTALSARVLNWFHLEEPSELVELAYVKGLKVNDVAALTGLVAQIAREGDRVACGIMDDAGKELARAAMAVARDLGLEGEFDVAYTGGAFDLSPDLLRSFSDNVVAEAPHARVVSSPFEPVVGAVFLALREVGVDMDERLLANIRSSLGRVKD